MGSALSDEDHEFIRIFLADLFAGVDSERGGMDRLRQFPIGEIKRIFFDEVSVACAFNLLTTTPEMGGFDPRWVRAEIARISDEKNASFSGAVSFKTKALFYGCVSLGVWRELKKSLGVRH